MSSIELPYLFAFPANWAEIRVDVVTNDPDFDRFFLTHYDGLLRSLTAITGDRERANDCVQEAFIRAFSRWRRIRRYDNPVTWVRRVAIHLSRDVHRSETRRRRREDLDQPLTLASMPSPESRVVGEIGLVGLLGQLTPQQRAVAALFYVEDISVAEIASSLSLSTGAVKFHLHKARTSLKALLESEEAKSG